MIDISHYISHPSWLRILIFSPPLNKIKVHVFMHARASKQAIMSNNKCALLLTRLSA